VRKVHNDFNEEFLCFKCNRSNKNGQGHFEMETINISSLLFYMKATLHSRRLDLIQSAVGAIRD